MCNQVGQKNQHIWKVLYYYDEHVSDEPEPEPARRPRVVDSISIPVRDRVTGGVIKRMFEDEKIDTDVIV